MKTATKSLLALTAADLMSAPVLTIPEETPLREAARLLSGAHVSGAPVVDAEGRCLGVLSSSDFVCWAGEGAAAVGPGGKVTCFIAPWGEMIDIEENPDTQIRQYMTAGPITATPATPLGEVARKMVEAHIHRVLVVDDQDRPRGIVTSTDVLAALSRTAKKPAR